METSIRMIFELFHSSKAVFTRNFFDLISLRVIQLADLYEFLWSARRSKLIDFNWNLESNKFLLDGEFSWRKFSFSFSIFEDPTISLFLRVAVDHEWQFFSPFSYFFLFSDIQLWCIMVHIVETRIRYQSLAATIDPNVSIIRRNGCYHAND